MVRLLLACGGGLGRKVPVRVVAAEVRSDPPLLAAEVGLDADCPGWGVRWDTGEDPAPRDIGREGSRREVRSVVMLRYAGGDPFYAGWSGTGETTETWVDLVGEGDPVPVRAACGEETLYVVDPEAGPVPARPPDDAADGWTWTCPGEDRVVTETHRPVDVRQRPLNLERLHLRCCGAADAPAPLALLAALHRRRAG